MNKNITRELQIEQIDASSEFLTFSICSDTPYRRYDLDIGEYDEILKITEDSIDWTRLKTGACAFLKDHNPNEQIGVIKKAWIEGNKLKCAVEFSSNPDLQYIIEDIKKGIRTNTSIGYQINSYHWENNNEVKTMIVDNFMIYEASLVSIPADETVGYNRSLEIKDTDMKKSKKEIEEEKITSEETTENEEKSVKEAEVVETEKDEAMVETIQDTGEEKAAEEATEETEEETAEVVETEESEEEEIRAAGELTGEEELAEECIKEKKSLQEFKNLIKEKRSINNKKVESKKDIKNMNKFSITKAIRNACKQYKEDTTDSYENQVIEANRRALKSIDNVSEYDVIVTKSQLRALGPSATVGAELINTDYLPSEYTPALRPQITLEQTGYKSIPVNGNAISFTVNISGAQAAMYDLDGELTDSDMTFALKELRPRKEGVCVPIPYSLILQGRPEVDAIVEADIVNALAELKDKMILVGTGADNQPTGIVNSTGVNTLAPSAIFTWNGVCTAEKLIRDSNDYSTGLAWVMNGTNKVKFETTLKDATTGYGGFLCEDDKIKGYPVFVNNALDDDTVILGNFGELVVCDFDGLFLKVDDITYIKRGAVQVVATACFDALVRRPKSFTVTKNA